MTRRLTLCAVLLLALLACACGDKKQALDIVDWPYLEKPVDLTVNGTKLRAFILKDEMHRRRGRNGMAIKAGEAIAYLYPKLDEAPKLKFNNVPHATKLVFVGDDGKVIKVEGLKPFSEAKFPQTYRVSGARVVLQVTPDDLSKLKLDSGAALSSEPNLLKDSDSAEGEFATVFFYTEPKRDEKPKDAPSIRVKVLDEPEDVARAMKDRSDFKEGDGLLIYTASAHADFWLKEVEGPCCACWFERGQGQFRGLIVAGYYENIKAEGSRDLDQPIYSSSGKPMYMAIFKGTNFFTKNKIEDRAGVSIGAMEYGNNEKLDYESIDIKFGDKPLNTRLVRGESQIKQALLEAPALPEGKGLVLDFNDPASVELDPTHLTADVELLFVSGDGTGKYRIAERKVVNGQSAPIRPGDFKHGRFVIIAARGFDTKPDVKFPYSLRDLKPSLPGIVFYGAKDEVVTDRWPANAKGRAHVELAISDAEQRKGLMYRTSLKPDHGMLFLYKEEQEDGMSYWMKNCKMDLSIAFIDRKGVIVKIHNRMKAPAANTPDEKLDTYDSGAACKYAIEMEAEWFSRKGIKEGDRVYIPAKLLESQ
jgi:uncharacterized membrane protein (UPF0127 family)